jgi:outer membrane protein assembly factor BamB
MIRCIRAALLVSFLALWPSGAGAADIANGWRGNGTGLWPDAQPPLEWYRIPMGVLGDLRARADKPSETGAAAGALRLENGIVPQWLVIGPFAVKDSVQDFHKVQLGAEATVQPAAGDQVGSLAWKKMAGKLDPRFDLGPADLPWTDLTAVVGAKPNQVGYAHTYLYSPRGGTVRAIVEHVQGLKVWLNAKDVYSSPKRNEEGMGNYYAFSRVELGIYDLTTSPRFDMELKPGWNRLLLKVSTLNQESMIQQQCFCMRLMDPPTVSYDSKNILWMAELPHRSNATPIIVGDRLFLMAEPDDLVCLDKHTGKILWTAANSYYELLTPAERQANPAFAEKIDPLLGQLKKETDFIKRQKLRTQVQKTLTGIDAERFAWKADGHFEGHFGIVGFTTQTPVSDGEHVWVWCGNGIAACYDLDGKRQWMTRVKTEELSYASSPALAEGTLAVFLHKLIGLDARTGQVRWELKKVRYNTGAVLAARIAGVPVFISQRGHVVRARDGHVLYRERWGGDAADTGWAPPVVLGDVIYLPRYGVSWLLVLDFAGASGDDWKPRRQEINVPGGPLPNGKSVDRWTAGSPLVVDDMAYLVDIYGKFYAVDLKAKKLLYTHDTELRGLFHYNAVPVAASATLIGKHIVIEDNQGTALVLQPGGEFRQLAKNRIATQLGRYWPIPGQETLSYSPPVPDGGRLYIRGERYLYCIAAK